MVRRKVGETRLAKIHYREATVADCASVAEVHVRSWRESFAGLVPQTFLERMSVERRARAFGERFADGSYRMFVAEVPGRGVVGFADCGPPRESVGAYEAELYAIYLLPEFQGHGVGGKLFGMVVEELVRRGKGSMYLLALEVSPYRRFYEKMGGRAAGRKQTTLDGVTFDALVYGWEGLR